MAVKWTEEQQIVWPTDKNRVEGMTPKSFPPRNLSICVIRSDVRWQCSRSIASRTLHSPWSSSGPAAYAVSLTSKKVTGSFIAMSVFKPDLLPPLEKAKRHGYFLYHSSPDDRVCPFRMAEQATKELEKSGDR